MGDHSDPTSPSITVEHAANLARALYGIDGTVSSLGSCQDVNFKIMCSSMIYVLKISNVKDTIEDINFQNDVIVHLNESSALKHLTIPKLVRLIDDSGFTGSVTLGKDKHYVRALTFVEGNLLSDSKYLSKESLMHFGSFIALTHEALVSYDGRSIDKKGQWDMRCSFENIRQRLDHLEQREQEEISALINTLQQIIDINSNKLRVQVIHGDLAAYNVITRPGRNGRPIVVGLIDFGDVTTSWTVGDLIIAIVPLFAIDDKDCLLLSVDIIRGYLMSAALSLEESLCLWPLVVLRAILLYATVSRLVIEDPDNEYVREESVLNKSILMKVLSVPLFAGQDAVVRAAGHQSPSQIQAALSAVSVFIVGGSNRCMTIDMSTLSDKYESKQKPSIPRILFCR